MVKLDKWIEVKEDSRKYILGDKMYLFENVRAIKISKHGAHYLEFDKVFSGTDEDALKLEVYFKDNIQDNVYVTKAIVYPREHTVIMLGIGEWTF